MLDEITATNLGIIDHAAVALGPGLTVITGETGTGKTLMLGALRLLRGDNAPKRSIGPGGESAEVSARFVGADGEELAVRRTVAASRSRAYLNGSAAAASELTEVVGSRVSIVGQHDHLRLSTAAGVRSLLDQALDRTGQKALDAYAEAWDAYQKLITEAKALGGDPRTIERERDSLERQVHEIESAALQPDEDDDLRASLMRMRNADALAEDLDTALRAAGDEGGGAMLADAVAALARASRLDEGLSDLAESLTAVADTLNEVTSEIARVALDLDADPENLAAAEARMAEIGTLKRKYGDTLGEIARFHDDAVDRIEVLINLEQRAAVIDAEVIAARAVLEDAAQALSEARRSTGERISSAAVAHLEELGFTSPVLAFTLRPADPGPHGADAIELLFASSKTLKPAPVGAGASGGELSRIVLALVLASGTADAELVAFDEIDAGVGGETALSLGAKLKALSRNQQVVCITHLPQVAAFADTHVVVERVSDVAAVRSLDDADRAVELSRMLAGLGDSTKGREHAAELLTVAATMSE